MNIHSNNSVGYEAICPRHGHEAGAEREPRAGMKRCSQTPLCLRLCQCIEVGVLQEGISFRRVCCDRGSCIAQYVLAELAQRQSGEQ